MSRSPWTVELGNEPLVATAIHAGHEVREEVAERLALSPRERLREEDPHTGALASVTATRIVARRSRFEVDLNRPREKAVYIEPDDAWGLKIWKKKPPEDLIERSRMEHDAFYREVGSILADLARRFGCFVVLDIHSYNHLRDGPGGRPAAPEANPEVNVGTGTMDRRRWAGIVDRLIEELRAFDFLGRRLDVRENVRFKGGYFPRWIHENFPSSGCALALEFKKFFMNEWTGQVDQGVLAEITRALRSTLPGIRQELRKLGQPR